MPRERFGYPHFHRTDDGAAGTEFVKIPGVAADGPDMSPLRLAALGVLRATLLVARPVSADDQEFRPGLPHAGLDLEISDDFGVWTRGRTHRGVDVFSPRRTPVLAVGDGVVTTLQYDDRPGWYIAIEHDGGWRSLYLHLDGAEPRWSRDLRGAETAFAPDAVPGMYVEEGQIIGFVGNSGNAQNQAPHTHFELHRDGEPVDPYPLLQAALVAAAIEDAIERGESAFR